ncbi:MAG: TlpA family protein disulfide reductase [Polyangiaceae bacterium]|nr:TlpA family protein disulfide reductase [Polyangiaceae bacterium]
MAHASRRALLVLGSLLLAACGAAPAPGASSAPAAARPPDFELDRLGGGTVRLADHLGKDVILLDFWATHCDPCLAAMPHLDALYRRHRGDGFVVLGISIDGPDTLARVAPTIARLGVTFPILLDTETRVVGLYNPKTSAPFSVLIGRDGGVVAKREGYTTSGANEVDRDVEAALAQ